MGSTMKLRELDRWATEELDFPLYTPGYGFATGSLDKVLSRSGRVGSGRGRAYGRAAQITLTVYNTWRRLTGAQEFHGGGRQGMDEWLDAIEEHEFGWLIKSGGRPPEWWPEAPEGEDLRDLFAAGFIAIEIRAGTR